MLFDAPVVSDTGLDDGTALAFNLDHPLVHQFAERLGRALLFHEFGLPYFDGEFSWLLNPALPEEIYRGMLAHGRTRLVHEVFRYGVTHFNPKCESYVLVNFYGALEMLIRVTWVGAVLA